MDEDGPGFEGFVVPLCVNHGVEAGVDEHVEFFGDGVEGDEVCDVEVFGYFEG